MFSIYVYVLDTLADWELGYAISELNSGRFFKRGQQRVSLKTVSYSKEPITTMGGMTIVPDCIIDDIVMSETSVLLLPGADTWNDPKHGAIIEKQASSYLQALQCVQSVGLPLRLPTMGYWIIGRIPVMDQDFLKCFLLLIKDRVFM